MNARDHTLVELMNVIDLKYLDSGKPHSFKLRPDGEIKVFAEEME